jgi:hypothetical protein
MNERIKQLAETAYRDVVCNHTIGDTVSREVVDQKFAELIIKECMSLTENYSNYWTQKSGSERIAKHFGVEE